VRQVIQSGGKSPPVAPAHIELGALLCEWNDLDSAAEHLNIGIELSQRTANQLILSDGYRTLAMVQLAWVNPRRPFPRSEKPTCWRIAAR